MKKIICFGDTVTEMGLSLEYGGYVARLSERYIRRADVLCRGFAGFTTREAIDILYSAVLKEHPDVAIVSFGIHDSVLSEHKDHVPPEEYKSNLQEIISRIAWSGAWMIVATPPPVDERITRIRRMNLTARYVEACHEIGIEMQVPVIDLFDMVQKEPDWKETCMLDGIYLAKRGMGIFYDSLIPQLDKIKPLDRMKRLSVEGL